jgi:hypothetical protein
MNTHSVREYVTFVPEELLHVWRKQRPISQGDFDSSVTKEAGSGRASYLILAPQYLIVFGFHFN